MRTSLGITATALLAVGLLVLTSVGAVSAAEDQVTPRPGDRSCRLPASERAENSVGNLRQVGDCMIDRRLELLGRLADRVDSAKVLTDADRSALSGQIAAASSGLTALRDTIDHETDVDALKADLKKIVTDYRVYVLVAPKTRLVIGADGALLVAGRFDTLGAKLAGRIADAAAQGKDVTAAQAALDAMNAKVSQARGLAQPLPAALLPLTAADYNAGTAQPVLNNARATLVQTRDLLKGARADAKACARALRALGG